MRDTQRSFTDGWYELHFEREEICEAMIRALRRRSCTTSCVRENCKHHRVERQLQERLREIDNALDALTGEKVETSWKEDEWLLSISDREAGLRPASNL
jgi:hypothetical protein